MSPADPAPTTESLSAEAVERLAGWFDRRTKGYGLDGPYQAAVASLRSLLSERAALRAQVASLTAALADRDREIAEARERGRDEGRAAGLETALASVGYATDQAEAEDRIRGHIAALRAPTPKTESGNG